MASVTEEEIYEITKQLGPDELKHLFYNLKIPSHNIENEEAAAGTTDPRLRAHRVLLWWRKNRGREATLETLNEAKGKAVQHDVDEDKWRERLVGKYRKETKVIRFGRSRFDQAETDDIFVDLTLLEETPEDGERDRETGIPRCKTRALESYNELFQILLTVSNRILLQGPAGIGKTTLMSRFSYLWTTKDIASGLDVYTLVFLIRLKHLRNGESLENTIINQLLPGVDEKRISSVLSSLGSKCLILLDGYDEIPKDVNACALKSPLLSDCHVIVTTRPYLVDQFCQSIEIPNYAHVKAAGFSLQSSKQYIQKYFDQHKEVSAGNALLDKINEIPTVETLSSYPILLVMLCLLWRDPKHREFHFNSLTTLFEKAVKYLNKGLEKQHELPSEVLETVLLKLGEVALETLLNNEVQIKSSNLDDESREKGFLMGLLVEEEGYETFVTFIHKTFQEFCAAKYLAHLSTSNTEQFQFELQKINSDILFEMENVLLFSCGLSVEAGRKCIKHAIGVIMSLNLPRAKHYLGAPLADKQLWSLPFLMVYEAEIYNNHPNEAHELHYELVPLIKHRQELGVISVSNKMTYISWAYLAGNRNSYLWLNNITSVHFMKLHVSITSMLGLLGCMSEVRSVTLIEVRLERDIDVDMSASCVSLTAFMMSWGSVSANTMMRLLGCMAEVKSVTLKGMRLQGDVDVNMSAPCKSLTAFTMSWGSVRSANTMIKLLGCMPEVKSVTLNDVRLEGDIVVNMSPSCRSHTEFTMRGGSVSANTMMRLMGSMPEVKSLTLNGMTLQGDVYMDMSGRGMSASCVSVTAFIMSRGSVSANTMMTLLGCMPDVKLIILDGVTLQGDVDVDMSASCKSLIAFTMSQGSVSANTMMKLLGCMTEVKSVTLNTVRLEGDVYMDMSARGMSASCVSLTAFTMRQGSVSANTMMKLLGCVPEVKSVTLDGVTLHGDIDVNISASCVKSLTEFTLNGGQYDRPLSVSANTMMSILCCMPSVKSVSLKAVDIEGDVDRNKSASCQSLTALHLTDTSVRCVSLMRLLTCMSSTAMATLRDVWINKSDGANLFTSFSDTDQTSNKRVWSGNTSALMSIL